MTAKVFKPSEAYVCNRVSKGDRHDTSIEYVLSISDKTHFWVTKKGGRFVVEAGEIVLPEPVETPPAYVEVEPVKTVKTVTETSRVLKPIKRHR